MSDNFFVDARRFLPHLYVYQQAGNLELITLQTQGRGKHDVGKPASVHYPLRRLMAGKEDYPALRGRGFAISAEQAALKMICDTHMPQVP